MSVGAGPLPAMPVCFWLSPLQMPAHPDGCLLQPQDLAQGWCHMPVAVPVLCRVPLAAAHPPPSLAASASSEPPSAPATPQPVPTPSPAASSVGAGPPVALEVLGNVWHLSQDSVGSRRVQEALDDAENDEARLDLALELRGHIWDALHCPHANHVLQRCIVSLRPPALQFILDELLQPRRAQVVQAARHRFGCRIIQRLFEHCRQDQLQEIYEELLGSAVPLSKHVYGNFVMQHLLEYGASAYRRQLTNVLERHVKAMVKDEHGHAVLSKAIANGSPEERLRLARALLQEGGLLLRMARGRHGHGAVKEVLEVLQGEEQDMARKQLLDSVAKLRLSRYGRSVAASLI